MTPEELASLFNAGGQDEAPVAGNRVREAVASLRGYAYQAYVTALEWTDLLPDAELHLEVAENFAVVAKGALRSVQVKDQAAAITLASEVARSALDAFVGLVAANPGRQVRMVFLTTASPALERTGSHRPEAGHPPSWPPTAATSSTTRTGSALSIPNIRRPWTRAAHGTPEIS